MADLLVLRHAATAWNEQRRLQGRSDVPLSEAGRAAALTWRLPGGARRIPWVASPLRRAQETAAQLGLSAAAEPCLAEMDWGAWEGCTLADLRASGALTADLEGRGLDLQPPGGESPRAVIARLQPWLRRVGERNQPVGAITHKGVLRALYAVATAWDMTTDPPVKLRNGCAHRFIVDAKGGIAVLKLNIPL